MGKYIEIINAYKPHGQEMPGVVFVIQNIIELNEIKKAFEPFGFRVTYNWFSAKSIGIRIDPRTRSYGHGTETFYLSAGFKYGVDMFRWSEVSGDEVDDDWGCLENETGILY